MSRDDFVNPLQPFVDALGEHEVRKAAGDVGDLVEVRCPECGWRAHSYTAYLAPGLTAEDGRAWLLAQHECSTR